MLPLDEYLKELYPAATAEEVADYIELLESDDLEKVLPQTKEIIEFLAIKDEAAKLKDRVDKLKSDIISQKERLKCNFDGINITKGFTKSFDAELFYKWVEDTFDPEIVEQVTIKTVDYDKLKKLEASKVIKYESIDSSCYDEIPRWTLTVKKKKK